MSQTAPAAPPPTRGSALPRGHGRSEDHSDAQAAWHALDEPQALSLVGVDRSGLSSTEAYSVTPGVGADAAGRFARTRPG
jgi:hypothetical protein